jgi:hypothetical protein
VFVYDPPHHMFSVTHGANSSRKFGLFDFLVDPLTMASLCLSPVYNGPQYHYQRDASLDERYSLDHSVAEYLSKKNNQTMTTTKSSLCTCGEYVGEFGSAPIDRLVHQIP